MTSTPHPMIDRTVTTIIDPEKCIGCGLCVHVCPSETITMQDEKAVVSGDRSLQCGHCAGVCPVDAVTVKAIDQQSLHLTTSICKIAGCPMVSSILPIWSG